MIKLSDDFKKAISQLPDKEKDKLLFRLLPKNEALVKQLEFKLLEGENTIQLRRDELMEILVQSFQHYPNAYYSPGYLMMHMRDMSGAISRHVKTTKDKVGEIELTLYVLVQAFKLNEARLMEATPQKMLKFNEYVVKRTLKIMSLVEKLHDDYRVEFQAMFKELGTFIGNQPNTMRTAIQLGLDVNLLINFE